MRPGAAIQLDFYFSEDAVLWLIQVVYSDVSIFICALVCLHHFHTNHTSIQLITHNNPVSQEQYLCTKFYVVFTRHAKGTGRSCCSLCYPLVDESLETSMSATGSGILSVLTSHQNLHSKPSVYVFYLLICDRFTARVKHVPGHYRYYNKIKNIVFDL